MRLSLRAILIGGLLLTLAVPALAQTEEAASDAATNTYSDRFVTFAYPSAWLVDPNSAPDDNTTAIANSENALQAESIDDFNPGDVQILVVKAAKPFFEGRLRVPLDNSLRPGSALGEIFPPEVQVTTYGFDDGRLAASVTLPDDENEAETVIWLVDLDENERGAFVVIGKTEDVAAAEADILAMAESFVSAELETVVIADGEAQLTETYVNSLGNRRLNYPEGWLIAENQRGVIIFGSSAEAIDTNNIGTLPRGEVLGLLYPAVALVPEIPVVGPETEVTSVVTFFANTGGEAGYVQAGPIETMAFNGLEAASSLAINEVQNHERLVIAVNVGDDIITILAFTPIGTMDDLEIVLDAMAASVEVGEFEVPAPPQAADAETTATEEAE